MSLKVSLPEKLNFLFEPMRYKVAKGGRGSAKSWGFARALILQAHKKQMRILCAREVQKSLRDSVYRLLCDQIEMMGLGPCFEILQTEIRHRFSGSVFLFTGLADKTADSIKSFEGIDRCWVEEAQTVSDRSWSILIPTIRKEDSEIWISFNPDLDSDPTYTRFIVNTPPTAKVVSINWDDNPWFPEVLRTEKDYLYATDPEAAAHVWGGDCRKNSNAQVLRGRYIVQDFTPAPEWNGPYQGADWGFATDPSVLVRCWIWERRLYVEHEAYGIGIETDHLGAMFDSVDNAREYVTRADNARPETISYMVRNGWKKMQGCTKWAGCVEDRVEHLRSYDQIVIHPRCVHTAEEARLWSFKVDKLTGDVMPDLMPKNDHCMDAIGYALEPIILRDEHKKKVRTYAVEDAEFFGYRPTANTGWMGG